MNKIEEFWYCVSPQENLPLYEKDIISTDDGQALIKFIKLFSDKHINNSNFKDILKNIILENPEYITSIRTLVGVSDKRLYLDLSFIFNRIAHTSENNILKESRTTLKKHSTDFFINKVKSHENKNYFADVISQYFVDKGLLDILQTFLGLEDTTTIKLFNYLIYPKEVQQKEAKLRGHGAEMAVAKILKAFDMNIYPTNKDTDTMGSHDPNVDLSCMEIVDRDANDTNIHSFDIVVKDKHNNIRILIQSLIHSSDPGQYGVDKSNETVTIKNLITEYNQNNVDKPVFLWGSVDGVGFIENPNGTIVKLLNNFDNFFQIDTLFKIPISLSKLGFIDSIAGIAFDKNYFEDSAIKYFNDTYLNGTNIIDMSNLDISSLNTVQAGKATLILK